MAFAPLYNKIAELEKKMDSMSGGVSMEPVVSTPVDLGPIHSKLAEIEQKMAEPTPAYATAESVAVLVEKYNQVTTVLTQFNMQLSSIVERISALEAK
jgi:hypothetical protein